MSNSTGGGKGKSLVITLIGIVIVAVVAYKGFGWISVQRKGTALIDDGNALYNEQKYSEAASKFREALDLDLQADFEKSAKQGLADANVAIVTASSSNRGRDETIALLEEAVEYVPDLEEAHMELGRLFLSTDKQRSLREFQRVLQINPDNSQAKRIVKSLERTNK